MSQTEDKETYEDAKMTPEEIEAQRQKWTEFYKNQIPHLEAQLSYETLSAKIEEQRAIKAEHLLKRAQIQTAFQTPRPGPDPDGASADKADVKDTASEKPSRTLKEE